MRRDIWLLIQLKLHYAILTCILVHIYVYGRGGEVDLVDEKRTYVLVFETVNYP
jgi:hypothetical protein